MSDLDQMSRTAILLSLLGKKGVDVLQALSVTGYPPGFLDEVLCRYQWTTEKPTKRGFYWFRETAGDELFMVEVYGDGTMWRSRYIEEEKMTDGQWAGPLEPPV